MTTEQVNRSTANQNDGQSQEAEKPHPLLTGIDFSDVPEAIRNEVKAKVMEKAKLYDNSYRTKTEMLAEEKKRMETDRQSIKALLEIQKELKDNPNMEKAVIQVINDFRAGKPQNSEANRDKNIKRLDKLIDNATDPDTREQLRQMREIVIEETDAPALKNELKELREELNRVKNSTLSSYSEKVDADINVLEEEFGKELVSKYREDIKTSALKFPNQRVKKILYHYAEDSEIEDALLKRAESNRKKELENKKNASTSDGRSISSKMDIPRDSRGRVHWRGFVDNLKTAGKFS